MFHSYLYILLPICGVLFLSKEPGVITMPVPNSTFNDDKYPERLLALQKDSQDLPKEIKKFIQNSILRHKFRSETTTPVPNGTMMPDTTFGRIMIDSFPPKAYYPIKNATITVCIGNTVPYFDQNAMKWVTRLMLSTPLENRQFDMDMRLKVYRKARSEVCHTKRNLGSLNYLLCSMRRNMRLRAGIPNYPNLPDVQV